VGIDPSMIITVHIHFIIMSYIEINNLHFTTVKITRIMKLLALLSNHLDKNVPLLLFLLKTVVLIVNGRLPCLNDSSSN
jgi:hypothetical protein